MMDERVELEIVRSWTAGDDADFFIKVAKKTEYHNGYNIKNLFYKLNEETNEFEEIRYTNFDTWEYKMTGNTLEDADIWDEGLMLYDAYINDIIGDYYSNYGDKDWCM